MLMMKKTVLWFKKKKFLIYKIFFTFNTKFAQKNCIVCCIYFKRKLYDKKITLGINFNA